MSGPGVGTPFFSVVIPVYNVRDFLEESVRSVTDQIRDGIPPVEIILVDDGSTDGSELLCDRIARDWDGKAVKVRVIHQENQGLLAARRAGYRVAAGDYLLNLDSDDWFTERALTEIAKAVRETQADVVFYNLSVKDSSGIHPYYRDVFTKEQRCALTREQVLRSYYTAEIPAVTSMCGKAFRRTCLETDRDYSGYGKLSMGEDTLQSAEVIAHAESFCYLNENLYIYRMGSGMTARFDPNYYRAFRRIMEGVRQYPCMVGTDETKSWFDEKILSSGCRAVTQSKGTAMSYAERKRFIQSVFRDEMFRSALRNTRIGSSGLKKKYKVMILLIRARAYRLLHGMLSPRGGAGAEA